MTEKILNLVLNVANQLNHELENKIPVELGRDAPLYGQQGCLDSLGIISFVADVEQAVQDEFEASITLVDEQAMSQPDDPFQTIGTLVDYIHLLLEDDS